MFPGFQSSSPDYSEVEEFEEEKEKKKSSQILSKINVYCLRGEKIIQALI